MFSATTLDQARQAPLPDLFKKQSIDLIPLNNGSSYKCCCPFHDDTNPSLHLNLKDNHWLWNCFGCGEGGSAIDFLMKINNLDFKAAVRRLTPGSLPTVNRSDLLRRVTDHFHSNLLTSDNKGKAYLEKRGLWNEHLIKTFKIGFSDGSLGKSFNEERQQLRTELGLFKINYYETFANCVVFPVLDLEGTPTDLYARRTMNYTDRANHCYNKGQHVGIFNHANVKQSSSVIVTEGIVDALSIYQAGFKNVTALYGTNGLTPALEKLLNTKDEIILALDNDSAGVKATNKIKERLKTLVIKAVLFPEGIKDANALLLCGGSASLAEAIESATVIKEAAAHHGGFLKEEEPPAPPEPAPAVDVETFTFRGPHLYYKTPRVHYLVRGVAALKSLVSLRLVITASLAGNVRAHPYTDRIDLYLSRSRRLFSSTLSRNFDVQDSVIETDLQNIADFIESEFSRRQSSKGEEKTSDQMSATDEQTALTFLKSPKLIGKIINDLNTLGYVGEDDNKLLLYLCATSRKLEKPISVLIRSQSSTGKSFLIDKVCDLLPSEDVHKWTSLTPKALYYMAEDALKHKFIAIDERNGMEEAEYPIRSLQSGGKLSLAVPMKNPSTGTIATEQITREGPIAYVDGSTDTRVNPENANRCFEIYLDESSAQTQRVQGVQRQAHSLDGWNVSERRSAIKRRHQNAQRLLKPVKVIIPFIDELKFPSDWIRTRRDHDRFLSLLVCITFLHQHQREQRIYQGKPYIESTVEDYAVAYHLAKAVLFNTFQELEKPIHDFYLQLTSMVSKMAEDNEIPVEEVSFTRRQVRQFTKLPDYLLKRFMRSLADLEYFHIKAGSQGARFVYRLVRTLENEDTLTGLTSPKELNHRISMTKGKNHALPANQ